MSKGKKYSGIIMPKFTLPDSTSTGELELEQIQAQHVLVPPVQASRPPLPQIQTRQMSQSPIRMPLMPIARPPAPFILAIEAMTTIHDSESFSAEYLDIEDYDALILDTVSMNAVKKIGAAQKVGAFFSNLFLLLVSFLFLCMLTSFLIITPNLTYKCWCLIALVISSSYIISEQMKRFDRARHKKILTTAQLAKKEVLSEEDDMMKHMKVIKEDTQTYLRAINNKDYRKKPR